jgi:hypothetical protein
VKQYVATFHTHVSALMTCRNLTGQGVTARMAPVPRRLSSSCGTCVFYAAGEPMLSAMDQDAEAVYLQTGETAYDPIWENA